MSDDSPIGKTGRVTGKIEPERTGEVMIPIRGGVEAFDAWSVDNESTISVGTPIVVIEYYPPRTVAVSKLY